MTKEELRKKIADKFIEWLSKGELTTFLDGEEIPTDTICVTIDVKSIDRRFVRMDPPAEENHLVIAVRTHVDKARKGTYDYIEVSATP